MSHSYIISPRRTPIGKYLQSLSPLSAPQLASASLQATIENAPCDVGSIGEVIFGNVISAGIGQAPARQAALQAGLPPSVPAVTINKVCGSGLKAIMLADQCVRAGDAQIVAAGGMESMSNAPYLLPKAREGWRFGNQTAEDSVLKDGLWCATENVVMGDLAEYTAKTNGVSRAAQDQYSVESHRRAVAAMKAGVFDAEIVPLSVKSGRKTVDVSHDEGPRGDASEESLGKLRPAFDRDGTVTAGNASQLSDGAASVLVTTEPIAREASHGPKARVLAIASTGVPPKEVFMAPVSAVQLVLKKAGLTVNDVSLFELNEAFAAQSVACMRQLELSADRVNVNGGAIALGHPIGASGARALVTLMHTLADRKEAVGVVSLCLGGGNAVAMAIELFA